MVRNGFRAMIAMTLTFVVLPLSFGAWFVGGPVALSLGGRAMKNTSSSETAASERRIARVGIFLSRLLLWGGIAFLALTILSNMFG